MLRSLGTLGFARVIATPHMRPGLFDNEANALRTAFATATAAVEAHRAERELPAVELACEHYFDDVVVGRIFRGEALPFPGGRAILLEFYEVDFPLSVDHRLADLRRHGLLPVIAHPERYAVVARDPSILERLLDVGAAALLDTAALVGKYGRGPRRTAERLLDAGLYHGACSDAHRPADVAEVGEGMRVIAQRYGTEEVDFLFREGPTELVAGRLPG